MTIEEYNRLNLVYETRAQQQLHQESKFMRANADEIASKYRREQLKTKRAEVFEAEVEEKEIERESYTEYEEEPGTSAFGKWQTVVRKYVDIFFYFFIKNHFKRMFFVQQRREADRSAITNISQ